MPCLRPKEEEEQPQQQQQANKIGSASAEQNKKLM